MTAKAARDRMDAWILAHSSYVPANEIKTLAGLMVWNMGYSTGLNGPVRIETSAMKQRSVVAVYLDPSVDLRICLLVYVPCRIQI